MENEKLKLILIIGSLETTENYDIFSWKQVPKNVPSIHQYQNVIIIPEKNTDEKQEQLIQLLQGDLSLLDKPKTRIIWLLNEHTIENLAEKLNLGKLIKLRSLKSGAVESYFPNIHPELNEVLFGFSNLAGNVRRILFWRRSDGKLKVPIGIVSPDQKYLLVPPASQFQNYITDCKMIEKCKRLAFYTIIFILTEISFFGYRHYLPQKDIYRKGINTRHYNTISSNGSYYQIRPLGHLPFINLEQPLDTTWIDPQKRLAIRLINQNRNFFTSAKYQTSLLPIFDMRQKQKIKGDIDNTIYFKLALLAGDLPTAYRIIKLEEMPSRYGRTSGYERRKWMQLITGTIWQRVLEYLHEYDFDNAKKYNDCYLLMAKHILKNEHDIHSDMFLFAMIANILHRELNNNRILSICKKSAKANPFGRIYLHGFIYPLPATEPDSLIKRRDRNIKKYEAKLDDYEYVDYNHLKDFVDLINAPSKFIEKDITSLVIFNLAPNECQYLILKNKIKNYMLKEEIEECLQFSSENSGLLSQNMLYRLLCTINARATEQNLEKDIDQLLLNSLKNTQSPGIYYFDNNNLEKSNGILPNENLNNIKKSIKVSLLLKATCNLDPQNHELRSLIKIEIERIPCECFYWDKYKNLALNSYSQQILNDLKQRCKK